MSRPRVNSRETELATAVRELRSACGETQQKFAVRIGIAITTIARYEIGHRDPDYENRVRLAKLSREVSRADLAEVFLPGTEEPGICSGCKWWEKSDNKEWGTCELTQTDNGSETLHETKAAAMDWESYFAILHTAPDFGCVQFQVKEAQ